MAKITFEEIKKVADENGVELTDEMLEKIAGGYDWPDDITSTEKKMMLNQSLMQELIGGNYCEYVH